jgi:hypothetical protein
VTVPVVVLATAFVIEVLVIDPLLLTKNIANVYGIPVTKSIHLGCVI